MESLLNEERINGSRIMIIDDDEPDVMFLTRVLEYAGYRNLVGFTDPGKGVTACRHDPTDMVLVDLHMPGLDGFDVLAQLRMAGLSGYRMPILVLTGDVRPEIKRKALTMGARDFLTKPADATEIMIRVRNALETRDLYRQLEQLTSDPGLRQAG